MNRMDIDLRRYIQQNHHKLTWKERIRIAYNMIDSIDRIHYENAIHRDLHSGNILFLQIVNDWFISDLGFCGPADKPLDSIYGNLPYIAPEVITGREYTFASDIYSFGILMWEISSGQQPFAGSDHDYDLAMDIVNGMRPKIISGTLFEYKQLMEQCWNANPSQRPNIRMLYNKIYQNLLNDSNESNENKNIFSINPNYRSSRLFTSKVYKFENFPEPRNATEGKFNNLFFRFILKCKLTS